MTTPLYRKEVYEARRNPWLGKLVLRQPLSYWAMTGAAIALSAMALLFLVFGEYARKARVAGQLVSDPPLVGIDAPAPGRIERILAEEGQWVSRDTVVARFRPVVSGVVQAPVTLQAGHAGQISAQWAHAGQTLRAGQRVLALLPAESRMEAELYLPGRALAVVEPGSPVLLRYRAFPYQDYGHYRGRVARIAQSPLPARQDAGTSGALQGDEPLYRVTVVLDDQEVRNDRGRVHALMPGLRVDAEIVLERRRLYQWLLEPLFAPRRSVQ